MSGDASAGGKVGARPRVGYLVNIYPKISHTFIRREILAVERQGVEVVRFALRGWDEKVTDPTDEAERGRTRFLLRGGLGGLVKAALAVMASRPGRFWTALKAAVAMGRRSVRPLPYHFIYLAHACRLLRWIEKEPVDHLHAHFGTNAAEIAHLLRLLGGPTYSFTVHGMDEIDNLPRMAMDRKIGGAKFVVGVSAFTRSQLMRYADEADWNRIKVVHCGIEPAFFDADPTPPPEAPTLLCIGRFSPEKGHTILLEAFAAASAKHPRARLVLAGDGDLRPRIEARIEALRLSGRVRITGWISSDQVRDEILRSTVIVQPSFQEGLPVVLMEAMALRRPVISTYVSGIPELVQEGRTGWLVPAGDIAGLAEAMDSALSVPAPAIGEMGEAARERAWARHNVDTEAAKLVRLFTEPAP